AKTSWPFSRRPFTTLVPSSPVPPMTTSFIVFIAGPMAQVFFADHTIKGRDGELFKTNCGTHWHRDGDGPELATECDFTVWHKTLGLKKTSPSTVETGH